MNIFDKTVDEYDDLCVLSYAWSFSRFHRIISEHVIAPYRPQKVLDIACGTGLQSYLYAAGGADVIGIDIAENLLGNAKQKTLSYTPEKGLELFPVYFEFVKAYNQRIAESIGLNKTGEITYKQPDFILADATRLPFPDAYFDHINLVGALSFIKDYDLALSEAARVLKPGGTFFLEAEARWNFQLFWRIISYLLHERSGEQTRASITDLLFTHPLQSVNALFPFKAFGTLSPIPARFFTFNELRKDLNTLGFTVLERWPVHSATNLIPWELLDTIHPSERLKQLFNLLAFVEERMPSFFPGVALTVLAVKEGKI